MIVRRRVIRPLLVGAGEAGAYVCWPGFLSSAFNDSSWQYETKALLDALSNPYSLTLAGGKWSAIITLSCYGSTFNGSPTDAPWAAASAYIDLLDAASAVLATSALMVLKVESTSGDANYISAPATLVASALGDLPAAGVATQIRLRARFQCGYYDDWGGTAEAGEVLLLVGTTLTTIYT